MGEIGAAWIRLRGDTAQFEKAMQTVSKKLNNAGQRMQEIGGQMSTSLTLPIMAVGAAALAAATSVEGAMATIRAGTGATGGDLEALGEDFRAVFKKVPENAQQVSTAIADLNTRLGLTGEPLRQLSEQMLELAGLTGTQIAPLIASTTRVFGDWSVATGEQSKTLDTLFKVSQATGLGVDRLSDSLVQFGAPLRQMGFSLQESALLMGKWEREGVNAELVLGSFRIAMGKFARDNVPMREGLDATMKRIQELGPSAEATALAMDVFGARAGPDMAAAILEGRFAIDELMAQIASSPETIAAAGIETETFAEKLAILRNNATLALEPIGTRLMEALTNIMPQLIAAADYVATLAERFGKLSPQTQTTILTIVGLVAALGPALNVFGSVATAISGIITVLGQLKIAFVAFKAVLAPFKIIFLAATAKVWLIIAAVAALAAGVVLLIRNWGAVGPFFAGLWTGITATFNTALTSLRGGLQRAWDFVAGGFSGLVGRIRSILAGVVDAITAPFRRAQEIVSGITSTISGFLQRLNPFARSSPSLVDNVRAGVREIQSQYAKLEQMQLPSITPQAGAAAPTMAAAGITAYHGPLFTVQNMTVRSDADIEAISRQLHRHIQAGVGARGI